MYSTNSLSLLYCILLIYYGVTHATEHKWGPEGNLQQSVLPFCHGSSGDQTRVVRRSWVPSVDELSSNCDLPARQSAHTDFLSVSLPAWACSPSICPFVGLDQLLFHFCIWTQLCGSAPILQPDWSRQPQQPLQPHPGPTAINTDSYVPIHVPSLASQVALKNFQVPWNFNPLWPFCNLHMAVHMDTITV